LVLQTSLLVVIPATPARASGVIWYVTTTGTGDCSSWANACNLQSALGAASSGDEIWVMAGTYIPTSGTDRAISFQLVNAVAIYGGFAGTETARSQRDPEANLTILSGEIGPPGYADNSLHVVVSFGNRFETRLDGFTITGGNADSPAGGRAYDGYGGGIYNTGSGGMINAGGGPTLVNITFSGNFADYGGGMYNTVSGSTLIDITFSGNYAIYGAGIYNRSSSGLALTNVTFNDNYASDGGGMYNRSSDASLTNVTISSNHASSNGGGIFIDNNSNPKLVNATFYSNSASAGGGGLYLNNMSFPRLTNVVAVLSDPARFCLKPASDPSSRLSSLSSYNLIDDGMYNCGLAQGVNGNRVDYANLSALGDYGGLTQTHALLAGSRGINAGTNTGCPATDQRGAVRPLDGVCDIGAFEYIPPPAVTTDAATAITSIGATLNGTVNANGADTAVTFQYGLDTAYGTTVTAAQSPVSGTTDTMVSYALTGLSPNTTYHFRAVGTNSGGTVNGLDATFTTACLSAITVSNANDSGPGSLSQAMIDLCSGGTITFARDLTILSNDPYGDTLFVDGNKTMTIDGSGHRVSINKGRIYIETWSRLNLKNLTFQNAHYGGPGGSLANYGQLYIENCTFLNSFSVLSGGAISNSGALVIRNSTFSGNYSDERGGAVYSSGYVKITGSTFSGNRAFAGASIFGLYSNLVHLDRNIMADGAGRNCSFSFTYFDNDLNLSDDLSCSLKVTQPLLGPLGNYGGDTDTFPLLPGSPAIDATYTFVGSDQRGLDCVGLCDIGAFQSQGFTLAKTGGDSQSAVINTAFTQPLMVSVTANNAVEPVNGGQITFTPPASEASAALTTSPATILGGVASVTATANGIVGGPYTVVARTAGATNVNFSLTNLGLTLNGQVRNDVDNDGDLSDTENGLPGVQLSLWTDPNGDGNPSDGVQVGSTVTTTGTGNYTFSNVLPGNYVVVETNPSDYTSSADAAAPNDDYLPVTMTTTNSFGNDFLDALLLLDFGDLPNTYGTLLASGGARHSVPASPTVYLGSGVDTEPNGAPTSNASGDDATGLDDENGVTFLTAIMPGQPYQIVVSASIAGYLNAWIDFNGNGAFDAGEQIATDQPLNAGSNSLPFTAPASATPFAGTLYSCFRFTSGAGQATTPTGIAPNGEVEDYALRTAIGDLVWKDMNSNGLQDAGEPGLSGVTVQLTPPATVDLGSGPGVAIITTTDTNGNYSFAGLVPGVAYTVSIPARQPA